MQQEIILRAIDKLVEMAEKAGFSVQDMLQLLNAASAWRLCLISSAEASKLAMGNIYAPLLGHVNVLTSRPVCKTDVGSPRFRKCQSLLVHESIKTTERRNAKWVKGLEDRLDSLVTAVWAKKRVHAST